MKRRSEEYGSKDMYILNIDKHFKVAQIYIHFYSHQWYTRVPIFIKTGCLLILYIYANMRKEENFTVSEAFL